MKCILEILKQCLGITYIFDEDVHFSFQSDTLLWIRYQTKWYLKFNEIGPGNPKSMELYLGIPYSSSLIDEALNYPLERDQTKWCVKFYEIGPWNHKA